MSAPWETTSSFYVCKCYSASMHLAYLGMWPIRRRFITRRCPYLDFVASSPGHTFEMSHIPASWKGTARIGFWVYLMRPLLAFVHWIQCASNTAAVQLGQRKLRSCTALLSRRCLSDRSDFLLPPQSFTHSATYG